MLHIDDTDGVSWQWSGRKVWVFVNRDEAAAQGIQESLLDAMRDETPGLYRFINWERCTSFQWTIVNEGDTLFLPGDLLHAVSCIGDEDAVASSVYCHIAGTPAALKAAAEAPRSRKRRDHTPPAPPAPKRRPGVLPVVQKAKSVSPGRAVPTVSRVALAVLVDNGQTIRNAAAMTCTSLSTAQKWNKRLREDGSSDDKPRSGRPRKTSKLDDAAIVRASELNHFATNQAIRHQLVLPISNATIGRRLDAAGLPSCIAAGKIHYTDLDRKRRLAFAHGYKHWTAEQWEKVIYGDEVTTEGEGRERQQRVRRPAGHRFDPAYTKHKQIFSPSQHLFACFCSRGPGLCEMYEGKLDGKSLKRLLDRTLVQTAAEYYDLEHGEQWWFVHDNSRPFKSREVQNWLHNHGVSMLDFPPRLPDLNIIENVWPRVNKLIDREHPTTQQAVSDAFKKCWDEVSLDVFTDFAQSMPARIAAVIAANGDATKY